MLTDQQHPITPPPELIRKWAQYQDLQDPEEFWRTIATQAARWGADQQLNACCEWLVTGPYGFSIEATAPSMITRLRAAMRPKPPSLAEQALEQLNGIETVVKAAYGGDLIDDFIRAALERLQELEKGNG